MGRPILRALTPHRLLRTSKARLLIGTRLRPSSVLLSGTKMTRLVPIQVLNAHPVKLSFISHSRIAHQDDDVPEKLKAAFPPVAGSSARQQFLFRFIIKPK